MEWISVKDRLPPEFRHLVCYCPGINGQAPGHIWMDSDYCIGTQLNGHWKHVNNENIEVSHWMELPNPPEEI